MFLLGSGFDFVFCLLHGLISFVILFQGPAQAQNLRDSLADAKSDIVVKVSSNSI